MKLLKLTTKIWICIIYIAINTSYTLYSQSVPERVDTSLFNIFLERKTISNDLVHPFMSPVVGDLDGDGIPEILTGGSYIDGVFLGYGTHRLLLFQGNNLEEQVCIDVPYGISSQSTSPFAIVRANLNGKEQGIIIVAGLDYFLHAFDNKGNILWESDMPYSKLNFADHGNSIKDNGSVYIADINNDGNPEIIVRNAIFSIEGKCLIEYDSKKNIGSSFVHGFNFSINEFAVVNMDDDPELEYVAGNKIYDIKITNTKGTSGNQMILKSILSNFNDGRTAVADIDGDGDLDVIVTTTSPNLLYIWDGQSPELMCKVERQNWAISAPLIANIYSGNNPEIIVCTRELSGETALPYLLLAYSYNNGELKELWRKSHYDASGFTGMTAFDFNGDGLAEICYRDQNNLRVLNGSLKSLTTRKDTSVYDLANYKCGSATTFEYPVIVDVDNDGHTEIVVAGDPFVGNKTKGAALMVLGNDEALWKCARPVWNQYLYRSVGVNDDLTIPTHPINSSIQMINGRGDLVKPYNTFLSQIGIEDELLYKIPFVDLSIGNVSAELISYNGITTFLIDLNNIGNIKYPASDSCVSIYSKDQYGNDSLFFVASLFSDLDAGEKRRLSIAIQNEDELCEFKIQLNDKGLGLSDELAVVIEKGEKYTNNTKTVVISRILPPLGDPHIELKGEIYGILTQDRYCDVDHPYLKRSYLGLDTEKNAGEFQVFVDSQYIPFIIVTWEMTEDVKGLVNVYYDSVKSKFHVKRLIENPNAEGKITFTISVGEYKKSLAVLLSPDFDGDGFPNVVERNSCIKTTHGIPNEWYYNHSLGDDDDDGISNLLSSRGDWGNAYSIDDDGDNIPNFLDYDQDGDGVGDAIEKFRDSHLSTRDVEVISPISSNDDALGNNSLFIQNIVHFPKNKIFIFNSSGVIVYEMEGYNNKDYLFPQYNKSGHRIPIGTYFYYLSYFDEENKETKSTSGFVTIRY